VLTHGLLSVGEMKRRVCMCGRNGVSGRRSSVDNYVISFVAQYYDAPEGLPISAYYGNIDDDDDDNDRRIR